MLRSLATLACLLILSACGSSIDLDTRDAAPVPIIEPDGGTFAAPVTVSIRSPSPGATIYYTLDGSDPGPQSIPYTGSLSIDGPATIMAITITAERGASGVARAVFSPAPESPQPDAPEPEAPVPEAPGPDVPGPETPQPETPAPEGPLPELGDAPLISPNGGRFAEAPRVTLTSTVADAFILYTLDGSSPATAGIRYDGPFLVDDSAMLQALLRRDGFTDSPLASAQFEVGNAVPVWKVAEDQTVAAGAVVETIVNAIDDDGEPPRLRADTSRLPGNPEFVDNGDGTGRLRWTTTGVEPDAYRVILTATDARFGEIGTTAVLLVTVNPVTSQNAFLQSYFSDGKVVIEAENQAGGQHSRDGHEWVASTELLPNPQLDNFNSGDAAISITPDRGTVYANFERDAARSDYRILFEEPGTYFLWARGYASDAASGVHFGLDGRAQISASSLAGFPPSTSRGWTNKQRDSGQPVTIEVDAAGEQTLNVWMDAPGVTLDKILLTPDPAFEPVGFGPQQSAQGHLPVYPAVADSHLRSWNFNEDPALGEARDSVSGKLLTCSRCPSSAPGVEHRAFSFGGNESLQMMPAAMLDFTPTQGFSVETILRSTSACSTAQHIVGRSTGNEGRSWYLACENGKAVVVIADTERGERLELVSSSRINDGRWHHISMALDAHFGEVRLYVDGELDTRGPFTPISGFDSEAPLAVAATDRAGVSAAFIGQLDALALHGRPLREDEIRRHALVVDRGLARDLWGCDSPVRIMPLGDSITAGTNRGGDKQWGTYRPFLHQILEASGYNVDFVGSYTGRLPDEPDRQHEGWPGITATTVSQLIDDWMRMNPPELILTHLGTNTLTISGMDDVLDAILATDPTVPTVVGKIVNRQTYHRATSEYNADLGALVNERIDEGDRLLLVDHEPVIDYATEMYNDLHPLQEGADKMAVVWFETLQDILPRCRPAAPVLPATDGISATTGTPLRFWVPVLGHPVGTFSLLSAPQGMGIHPTTGELRWLSPENGTYNVKVRVENASGSATRTYRLAVTG